MHDRADSEEEPGKRVNDGRPGRWWLSAGAMFAIAAVLAVFGVGLVVWGAHPATGTGLLQVAAAAAAVGAGLVAIGGQIATAAQLKLSEGRRAAREWQDEVGRAALIHTTIQNRAADPADRHPDHDFTVAAFVINHSQDVVTDLSLLLAGKRLLGEGFTGGLYGAPHRVIATDIDWRDYRKSATPGENSSFANLPSPYQDVMLPALPAGGLAIIGFWLDPAFDSVSANQYQVVLEYTDVRGKRWECETGEKPRLASEFDDNGEHRWFRTTMQVPGQPTDFSTLRTS